MPDAKCQYLGTLNTVYLTLVEIYTQIFFKNSIGQAYMTASESDN